MTADATQVVHDIAILDLLQQVPGAVAYGLLVDSVPVESRVALYESLVSWKGPNVRS